MCSSVPFKDWNKLIEGSNKIEQLCKYCGAKMIHTVDQSYAECPNCNAILCSEGWYIK